MDGIVIELFPNMDRRCFVYLMIWSDPKYDEKGRNRRFLGKLGISRPSNSNLRIKKVKWE